jgi:sugar lactone lactonase YvrE
MDLRLKVNRMMKLHAKNTESASIELPGDKVFPESITSTQNGTLFVGSLGNGGVVRIRLDSRKSEVWIKPGAFGTRSILGVLAHEPSSTLWVCSNDMTALGINTAGSATGSAIKGFDLSTGEGKISATLPGGAQAVYNDIAVGPDGSVFVTNSVGPEILRLRPGTENLEVWARDPLFASPPGTFGLDGIAFGEDDVVYVSMYASGKLLRVNARQGTAGSVTILKTSRPLVLPDAIRPIGKNEFLLIEGEGRLDRMVIKGDEAVIETIQDGYSTPTGVTAIGATAWVSEGQLPFLLDPSEKGQNPDLPFRVYSVGLADN